MAVVVVDEGGFGVVVLATPLDGLGDIAICRDFSVGGVAVGGAEVAVLAEDFADVLGEIPAVGVPGAVFADGQGARGNGLSRVTRRHPIACSPLRGKRASPFVQSLSNLSGAFPGDVPERMVPEAACDDVNSTCQHRLGGDVGGGYRAVSGAFRTIVIHRPIHRSQATFVYRNNFFLQGVVQLRDELHAVAVGAVEDIRAGDFALKENAE